MRPLVSAAIIAVGSELLTPTKIDTNSLAITAVLNELGIAVRAKTIVGDSRADLAAAIREALARVDLVVLTGGLGPTDDDVTRDVVADVLGRTLHEEPALVERLRARFASRGLSMPEINRRQAMVPGGAEVVPNPLGTAPGLWIDARRPGRRAPARPAARAEADDRAARPRAAGAAGRSHTALQRDGAGRRAVRVARRAARPAALRSLAGRRSRHRDHDARRAGLDRFPPDRARG